ncbi:MAG: 2-C-methyl-D-erythritol 4-phosphate cytidylyltransferase [Firmicutes bacterium]|nr:2-C-methyl-D-erythritol 4-phosphate cytidylyltransferase [Bacillota bacterium]
MNIAIILAAAGCGSRMEAAKNKVLLPLGGLPLLCRSLGLFQNDPLVSRILVTAAPGDLEAFRELILPYDKARLCLGGASRQESISLALAALQQEATVAELPWDRVAVHDGARPLLSLSDWQRLREAAENASAALLVRPMTDTVKQTEGGKVLSTIPRESLSAALTPQIFETKLLLEAYAAAREGGYSATDDAELVEKLGLQPLAIPARDPNPKITFPPDLAMAEALLSARQCRKESREK